MTGRGCPSSSRQNENKKNTTERVVPSLSCPNENDATGRGYAPPHRVENMMGRGYPPHCEIATTQQGGAHAPPHRVTGTTREGGAPFPCVAGLLGKLVNCYWRKICGRTCMPSPSTSSWPRPRPSTPSCSSSLRCGCRRCVVAVG